MTESPTPGRHRGRRAAPKKRRGLIGPILSALSVVLAIGPVVWLVSSNDGSPTADDTKVLNISQDDNGPAVVDDTSTADGKQPDKLVTVTATLPNGVVTTITPSGTPLLGPAESTTSDTPSGGPSTPGDVTTVTITPTAPRSVTGGKPTYQKPPSKTPTKTTTTTEPPADPPPPPPGGGGTSSEEREVLDLTNQARRQQGCKALSLNDSLVEAAGSHASDMVNRQYMSHTNPDGQDPGDRMAAAGWSGSSWAENIAAGFSTAQKVFNAWMNSEDGHRENILNCKFTKIGIGYDPGRVGSDVSPGSWVQDFGRN